MSSSDCLLRESGPSSGHMDHPYGTGGLSEIAIRTSRNNLAHMDRLTWGHGLPASVADRPTQQNGLSMNQLQTKAIASVD
jgi:hypothetical protein